MSTTSLIKQKLPLNKCQQNTGSYIIEQHHFKANTFKKYTGLILSKRTTHIVPKYYYYYNKRQLYEECFSLPYNYVAHHQEKRNSIPTCCKR